MPFRINAVLVASDLSERSDTVVRAAGALAALTEAELHVVHALEPAGQTGETGDRALHDARSTLESRVRAALPSTVAVTSFLVAPGHAHEIILQRAAEVRADLLVVGPHRGRQSRGEPLGTTVDRLVRTAEVPCLIVHRPLSLPLRRIVVPSDMSEAAAGALDVAFIWGAALRMPTDRGVATHLDVVHALAPTSEQTALEDDGAATRELRELIAAAEATTGSAGLMQVDTAVLHHREAEEAILRFAQEVQVDLLVLGTHGQSALTRALVGSVSSAVARRAESPVLLVPPGFWKTWQQRNDTQSPGRKMH